MNVIDNPSRRNWKELTQRPQKQTNDLRGVVEEVFATVQKEGDRALRTYTQRFDRVSLEEVRVSREALDASEALLSDDLKDAIVLAKKNIEAFHRSQITSKNVVETAKGVQCWQEMRPIEKVGLYVPGGTAPLFSTVLMLGIPAVLAGCKDIVLCSPPDKEGNLPPAVLYTAKLIGIDQLFKVGGVQAIASMTYGTESVPKVYKLFGPGNQYVTAAKQYALTQGLSIDMPAGPSELMVVADENANPDFVASDLLSQAEHGSDSQVICIAQSTKQLETIQRALSNQMKALPRKEIAAAAMQHSKMICFSKIDDQIDFINEYAPEHLILNVENEALYLDQIQNSGSVFIGPFTPESAGDYASGTNHTLPTNAFARMYSGINMDAFTKKITFQKISATGIQNIGAAIESMAEAEGLQAHKNAVTLRLQALKAKK